MSNAITTHRLNNYYQQFKCFLISYIMCFVITATTAEIGKWSERPIQIYRQHNHDHISFGTLTNVRPCEF